LELPAIGEEFGVSAELSGDRVAVLEALRRHAVAFDENLRRLGAWMGVSATDAMALADVIWAETSGQPMTPARLARRTTMSSGSTTALIDRLERGGHLVRSRESTDRRVVTLRPSDSARARAQEYFDRPGDELRALLRGFDDEAVRQCAEVLGALVAHLEADLARAAQS
jgi:MarR family transcriptional regulator, organic hydroperoxide resistance regulator